MMAYEQLADKHELAHRMAQLDQFIQDAARDGVAAHVVEEDLFRRLLSLGHQLFGQFLAAQGAGDVGQELTLPDGKVLQRQPEPVNREHVTIFGKYSLPRIVYSEGPQKKQEVPLDARLQLPESKFSHLVQSWTQLLATEQPYNQVSATFDRIFRLRLHVDSLERTSRHISPDAEAFGWELPAPPAKEEGEILVESADGKGIPIRHAADVKPIVDHQPRTGPKPDRKRVATLGAVYSVDRFVRTPDEVLEALFRDPEQDPPSSDPPKRPRPRHKWSYARLDDEPNTPEAVKGQPVVFGWLDEKVRARLRHRRENVPVVCLMDGQQSLWDMKAKMQADLPTVEILDLLHVTPRLWAAAKLFHPGDRRSTESFVREQTGRILHGRVKTVVHSLRARATRRKLSKRARRSLERICRYFEHHQSRMRYDEYLRDGFPIASGVIEGACRHIVKDRLERTGMSWTRSGANAMLILRAIKTADNWDSFLEYRINQEVQRLYRYRDSLDTLQWPIAA